MSARRDARARTPVLDRPSAPDGVPPALAIGRCVEVWAEHGAESPTASTMRRFNRARDHWAALAGADAAEMRELIPNGEPWTLTHLTYVGQAERVGRPLAELVDERLAKGGCTREDLPMLAQQADDLFAAALGGGALTRSYKRRGRTR